MPRKRPLNASSERLKRRRRKLEKQLLLNCQNKQANSLTTKTCNDQSTVVVKSELFEYEDDIPLTQVNSEDVCIAKRKKQAAYIQAKEFESPRSYIKSEEITEDKNPELTNNFILYEINEINPSIVVNVNELNSDTQRLQKPSHSENSKMVWNISKINRMQNKTISNNPTTNSTATNRLIPKTQHFVEIPGTSSSKQKASSGRKVTAIKISGTPNGKVITTFSEATRKCACHLNPMKNVDVHSNLELKDFFETMFEETRKLKIEDRQAVKTELLKAVSQAEEDVEAGKFCEKCYTMFAQSKKRY
ncbi:uncharacterized protein [Bactrocera oleae]|uniref:uncharacterized protein n=1 Tax=Bactrocera oleae TaxID=104688 RepID=UPI00387E6F69